MAWVIGKLKCYFCGAKGGLFHSVHDYGIYGDVGKRIFYHSECLEMVEIEPEKFGHILTDRAIHIHELRERNIPFNLTIEELLISKVEKLHKFSFERMMPKKQ